MGPLGTGGGTLRDKDPWYGAPLGEARLVRHGRGTRAGRLGRGRLAGDTQVNDGGQGHGLPTGGGF